MEAFKAGFFGALGVLAAMLALGVAAGVVVPVVLVALMG